MSHGRIAIRRPLEELGGDDRGSPGSPSVWRRLLLLTAGAAAIVGPVALSPLGTSAASVHQHVNCIKASFCTEVVDSEQVFGEGVYVGHDEPSLLFYSNKPGSGNRYSSLADLPKQPATNQTPGKASYDFQLHPAFWFGMAMCDTQSYPELLSTCTPDSNSNIVDPAVSRHACRDRIHGDAVLSARLGAVQ